jgi:hypothetical protein
MTMSPNGLTLIHDGYTQWGWKTTPYHIRELKKPFLSEQGSVTTSLSLMGVHLGVHSIILGVVSAIVSLLQTWSVQRFGPIYGGVIGYVISDLSYPSSHSARTNQSNNLGFLGNFSH